MIEQGHIAEANDRTVGAFTAVLADYRKRLVRTLARRESKPMDIRRYRNNLYPVGLQPRVKATIYYLGTIQQLENLNG